MSLSVKIRKRIGQFNLDIEFCEERGVLGILGASGCGKSVTLKCIAGIMRPDSGHIELDGRVLFDSERKIDIPPGQRRVGYMFQDYALFPNMTVYDNLRCAIRQENHTISVHRHSHEVNRAIDEMLERMELTEVKGKYPAQLSGGQKQRTALARILLNGPEVLLLDEPFSALDTHLRFALERELSALIRQYDKTVVFVSHDRDEIYRLSDDIAVMNNGHFDTVGSVKQVFANPTTITGARLTGCKNIASVTRSGSRLHIGDWNISLSMDEFADIDAIGIRMHDIRLVPCDYTDYGDENIVLECVVEEETENPFSYTVMLRPNGSVKTIGAEIDKLIWSKMRSQKAVAVIKKSDLIVLSDDGHSHM